MDVRAPVEFNEGSIPGATNLPLLTDEERHQIGLCYKEKGQAEAIRLGDRLVSGETRAMRIQRWRSFFAAHPEAVLYCFRGGLRSTLVAQTLSQECGLEVPVIRGGYKALRRFLMGKLAELPEQENFVCVTGRTGTGKTALLEFLAQRSRRVVDLEGLARHRGSAFGALTELTTNGEIFPKNQPTQIDFENQLAVGLLRLSHTARETPILIEDESRLIGRRLIPEKLFNRVQAAPLVVVEASHADRVDLLLRFYLHTDYGAATPALAQRLAPRLGEALHRHLNAIAPRLGGLRAKTCREMLDEGLRLQAIDGSLAGHQPWIVYLLENYYDPLYDAHIARNAQRIVFRGSAAEVQEYLLALRE